MSLWVLSLLANIISYLVWQRCGSAFQCSLALRLKLWTMFTLMVCLSHCEQSINIWSSYLPQQSVETSLVPTCISAEVVCAIGGHTCMYVGATKTSHKTATRVLVHKVWMHILTRELHKMCAMQNGRTLNSKCAEYVSSSYMLILTSQKI